MASSQTTVAFYLQFGQSTGLGHLVRSGALALACRIRGAKTVLVVDNFAEVPVFCQHYFDEYRSTTDLSEQELSQFTELVVDHYTPNENTLNTLQKNNPNMYWITDDPDAKFAPNITKICQLLQKRTEFVGPEVALLRPAFAQHRIYSQKRDRSKLDNVFLAFGGTDPNSLLPKVIEGLADLNIHLTVSTSSLNKELNWLKQYADKNKLNLLIDIDETTLANTLCNMDLVIGYPGSSIFEWCSMGVPSLVTLGTDNQKYLYQESLFAGVALDSGDAKDPNLVDTIRKKVNFLKSNPQNLKEMSVIAFTLSDGLGAFRVASQIVPTQTKKGLHIHLRPVTPSDAKYIFDLQQLPETRKFARQPKPPQWEEHLIWFKNKLSNPSCIFSVVQANKVDAGIARLDFDTQGKPWPQYEVSIFLDPKFYGQGIASAALKELSLMVPFANIKAFVMEENLASKKTFERAGYRFQGEYYTYQAPLSKWAQGEEN